MRAGDPHVHKYSVPRTPGAPKTTPSWSPSRDSAEMLTEAPGLVPGKERGAGVSGSRTQAAPLREKVTICIWRMTRDSDEKMNFRA